jgi:hypothetical protein
MLLWAEGVAQITVVRNMYIILVTKPGILHNDEHWDLYRWPRIL